MHRLRKYIFLPSLISMILMGCSTHVFVQKSSAYAGKKVGIGMIDITSTKRSNHLPKDSICPCVGLSAREAFLPYLQQAGFKVIVLPLTDSSGMPRASAVADSIHVDYLLTGSGIVQIVGGSNFMEQLNVHLISTDTREVHMSASFTGTSVGITRAVGKIGKRIVKKIEEK